MKNAIKTVLNTSKNEFVRKTQSLTKTKKTLFVLFLIFIVPCSIASSIYYGKELCNYFHYIGAIDKAVATIYVFYTTYSLVYNVFNGNECFLKGNFPTDNESEKIYVLFSKIFILYLHNLAISFYFVFFPMVVFAGYNAFNTLGLILSLLFIFIIPLFPMALSTPFIIVAPKKANRRLKNTINAVLFITVLIITVFFSDKALNYLLDHAYTLSVIFTKYYFPAALFENTVIRGTGIIAFVFTNISAFCLYMAVLIKTNKIKSKEK